MSQFSQSVNLPCLYLELLFSPQQSAYCVPDAVLRFVELRRSPDELAPDNQLPPTVKLRWLSSFLSYVDDV